ncbi:ACT domain-containing protein [Vibrio fluvialis]|uniref:ACT domain-containing protein n=1 Tax=Vibrio TaxID=662 RepID=UPI001C9C7615|nr:MULTISPECIES: ACT domain-containing protein [Vibrio]ELV8694150.1 ACT domain-containing protein [Vibrio fluvialis]MBY7962538.1 ACT domain-containing protein [Vibrio fluvialis]MBY8078593.1 ACT domain-containing protein [Vibrio fluvialis]USP06684.1 ACT domain-containing protein [Vibrio sp. LQ2]WMN56487.1 ACT domain-containing protein [Vibrio fluvialis]
MVGITELQVLLQSMQPELKDEEVVFCSVSGDLQDYLELKPLAMFHEREGLTLVLSKVTAQTHGLAFDGSFQQITLNVHSSLEAVGLTAAVSAALTQQEISANVIAAYYHDHIFVPTQRANDALNALKALSNE